MAAQLNDTVGIYPQQYEEKKMEERIQAILKERFGRDLDNCTKSEIFEALMVITKQEMAGRKRNTGSKKLYYISAEFLIGKLLSNNLINLGMYEEVEKALAAHGRELTEIEEMEMEPSLGNGGLGRLAACFLDSIATLGLPGDGIGLNYHFGLFRQLLVDHKQKEVKNPWITNESWLVRQPVSFAVPYKNFTMHSTLYDIDVPGYNNGCNRLHLFDVDTVDESIVPSDSINFDKHQIQKNLTLFLYPDDSDRAGQLLRIYQQYFMVSNAARLILDEAIAKGSTLYDLADYAVIQINDTHPTMVIPELIRLLTTEHGMEMDDAIEIVSHCCAYTNHTILAEALEKWPVEFFKEAVPQLLPIMEVLDDKVRRKFDDTSVYIIDKNDLVHMAHIDIHYGFSVNGVAALHTDILKETELNNFYKLYPEKFNNKTNGITFRRWLLHSNPELTNFITEFIGDGFKKDAEELKKLDTPVITKNLKQLYRLLDIKAQKKAELAKYLEETQGITINPDSIFDIQIKRLHEYKRQQMNALYLIHKYLEIKKGKKPTTPITAIFGAKAAPAYIIAKDIIHMILCLQQIIDKDPEVKPYLNVVMVNNYNVTLAEKLIPACDISEQISLASKEASGTGNMKFMLNGAVTLGTDDGANVEIHELVGDDNIYIFGDSSETVIERYKNASYCSKDYYDADPAIKEAVDFIISKKMLAVGDKENLERLYKELLNKDWFMTFPDFKAYCEAKEKAFADYEDRTLWARKMLVNISQAGYFSSDRTIGEYDRDIWKLR